MSALPGAATSPRIRRCGCRHSSRAASCATAPARSGLGSVGWGFGNGLRLEVEGNYRRDPLQHFRGTPFPTLAGGYQEDYGAMGNVLFDMDIGKSWLYPYFGAGAGYIWTHAAEHYSGTNYPYAERLGGTDGNFAYQGIFGLSVPVPWVVGLSSTLEYRFTSILGPQRFTGDGIGAEGAFGPKPYGTSRGNQDITTNFNHSLLLGVRYEFNPAPPPPARRAVGRTRRTGACGSAHLPRVLRLGRLGADHAGARDRRGGRPDLHPRADHPHRGERLRRHLVHPWRRTRRPLQPGPLHPPRHQRQGRADPRRRAGHGDRHPRLRRDPPARRHRAPTPASRRTAASRSSCASGPIPTPGFQASGKSVHQIDGWRRNPTVLPVGFPSLGGLLQRRPGLLEHDRNDSRLVVVFGQPDERGSVGPSRTLLTADGQVCRTRWTRVRSAWKRARAPRGAHPTGF